MPFHLIAMSPKAQRKTPLQQSGVALIEALVAILIFSIGVLGLVGLQSVSAQSTTMSKSRVDASLVASQQIALIWGDMTNPLSYVETDTPISALPNGKRTTEITDGTGTAMDPDDPPPATPAGPYTVTVTVTWDMPSEPGQTYTTVAMVSPR